eukprot:gene2261-496_t
MPPKKIPRDQEFRVSWQTNGTFDRLPGKLKGRQFQAANNIGCTIRVFDTCDNVMIDDCEDCTFVFGPVQQAVFLRDCKNCTVTSISSQFRINGCHNMDCRPHGLRNAPFRDLSTARPVCRIYCLSDPTLEKCTGLKLSPFNLMFPGLAAMCAKDNCSIDLDKGNHYAEVHDFQKEDTRFKQDTAGVPHFSVVDALPKVTMTYDGAMGEPDMPAQACDSHRGQQELCKPAASNMVAFDITSGMAQAQQALEETETAKAVTKAAEPSQDVASTAKLPSLLRPMIDQMTSAINAKDPLRLPRKVKGEHTMWDEEVSGMNLIIASMDQSKIKILDQCGEVLISKCKNSEIVVGPCSSLILEDVTSCTIQAICGSLAALNSTSCTLRCYVASQPIFEACTDISLAPWNIFYAELPSQVVKAEFKCKGNPNAYFQPFDLSRLPPGQDSLDPARATATSKTMNFVVQPWTGKFCDDSSKDIVLPSGLLDDPVLASVYNAPTSLVSGTGRGLPTSSEPTKAGAPVPCVPGGASPPACGSTARPAPGMTRSFPPTTAWIARILDSTQDRVSAIPTLASSLASKRFEAAEQEA